MSKTIALKKSIPYDIVFVIGRFQPLHNGHLDLIGEARKFALNCAIMIGSSQIARTTKNPFSFAERSALIHEACGAMFYELATYPIVDDLYSDKKWAAQIQSNIKKFSDHLGLKNPKVLLVGHNKDESSYYLKMFPQYDYHEFKSVLSLDATEVRKRYFSKQEGMWLTDANWFKANIPDCTWNFLGEFQKTEAFVNLYETYHFLINYNKDFANYKYGKPIFTTTDAVVICGSSVLMIKRKANPGKGLWALPGGFLDAGEFIKDGIVRELIEETKISENGLPYTAEELKQLIKHIRVFDHPNRSIRGRTITHAGLIVIESIELPYVKGSDDAADAKFIPLDEIMKMGEQVFEDHLSIIKYMTNRADD